jgi:hypothetical protein
MLIMHRQTKLGNYNNNVTNDTSERKKAKMPLESGHKVTIWSIENKGTYSKASLTGQKKDKSGQYQTDWSNPFCTLFGKAHDAVKDITLDTEAKEHVSARIGWGYDVDCETDDGRKYTKKQAPFSVSNNYDKAKKINYTNYAIYDLELIKANKSENDNATVEESNPFEQNMTAEQEKSQPATNGLVGLDFLNIPDGASELPFK